MKSAKPSILQKKAQREARWLKRWQTRNAVTRALWPVSWLFQQVVTLRRKAFLRGWRAQYRVPVPVIVIGGIMIGGVGKTPIVVQLVQSLKQAGYQPAIITRGYGSREEHNQVQPVDSQSLAEEVGDEPLLLAQNTGVPVWVGADRVNAARAIGTHHPECDVIVCDDGLQHYRLYRDIEVAVVDERGVGNGWCLPAGPLREPPQRLSSVSAVVLHQRNAGTAEKHNDERPDWPLCENKAVFKVQSELSIAYALAQVERTIALNDWVQLMGQKVLMLAGIARPQVFFDMLAGYGITGERYALPDHAPMDDDLVQRLMYVLQEQSLDFVLMTEKDAVKCLPWLNSHPQLAEKIWVVPLRLIDNENWQNFSFHVISELERLDRKEE